MGSKNHSFTEINLVELQKKKVPKRLLHFSDGVMEEYSSDDDELCASTEDSQALIDPKTLTWVPYFGYLIWMVGSRTLAVCDYLGENLAWFLGITSPKFQYELDQYEKIEKEEKELQEHIRAENAGWSSDANDEKTLDSIAIQPQSSAKNTELVKNTKVSASSSSTNLYV